MLRAMDPKWKGSLSSNTVKAHDANTRNTRDNSSHVDTIDLIPNDIPLYTFNTIRILQTSDHIYAAYHKEITQSKHA